MPKSTVPQNYPRITDENSQEYGCLDISLLVSHKKKISFAEMERMIRDAIRKANQKSSRRSFSIPPDATAEDILDIYHAAGKDLFKYFRKYCGDPAATAYQAYRKHYRDIGAEQFRNRTVQRGRMNSGWRYQFLVLDCAIHSERFRSVSDLGMAEADFNVDIEFAEADREPLNLYVSVKNRKNTLGGQDWPKSIRALEDIAKNDRNRTGPYCCVFGIVMDRGQRYIKIQRKTGQPYSFNTEIWLSDFLWPFFANYSYEEIMTFVLDLLLKTAAVEELSTQMKIPEEVLECFGELCRDAGLLDAEGYFDDSHKLVKFFVSK